MSERTTLTNKQKAFCEEYVANGGNATQAYMFAYYGDLDPIEKPKHYETARSRAYQMLRLGYVKEYLTALQKEAFERAMITPEKIVMELNRIAFETDASYADKLKALNLIQKQMGMITEQVKAQVDTKNTIEININ